MSNTNTKNDQFVPRQGAQRPPKLGLGGVHAEDESAVDIHDVEVKPTEADPVVGHELDDVLDEIDFDFDNHGPLSIHGLTLDRTRYEYRFVRYADGGTQDPTNIALAYREGYRPYPVEGLPVFQKSPQMQDGAPDGSFLVIKDQVLCYRPRRIADKHLAAAKRAAAAPMEDITRTFNAELAKEISDGKISMEAPHMTFKEARGRRAAVAEDDE